ncbi:DUF1402 family protein, partial [Escherichia coli]|nr:DUF1402 family protein [Escherichia coli]
MLVIGIGIGSFLGQPADAANEVLVPPGNRSETQPPIPKTSADRAKAFNTTYDEKYKQIVALLTRETKLVAQIKDAARAYHIDPIHIVG